MLDLSLIIPSWNAKKYLCACIESIYRETGNCQFEIIVVDNGSSDGSSEMVEETFSQVKLVKNKDNLGFAKACNIGIKRASGKYLIIINSDVLLEKKCIELMLNYMKQQPQIGILGPQIHGQDGLLQRSCMGFPNLWSIFCRALALDTLFPKSKLFGGYLMRYWNYDSIRDVDIINGCLWMVRKSALEKVGLLDEQFFFYAEDKDWCKRFNNGGWKVTFYPEAKIVHYGGASSANAPIKYHKEYQKANLQYWQKHYNYFSFILYILISFSGEMIRLVGQSFLILIMPSKKQDLSYKIKRSIAGISTLLNSFIPKNNKN